MMRTGRIRRPSPDAAVGGSWRSFPSFVLLCLAMFLNLILAFLHARGIPFSSGSVVAVQAVVTVAAAPALFSTTGRFGTSALCALAFIAFCVTVTNFLNPFNAKTIYDSLLIPIYISLGMAASYVRPKWMNYILLFVVLIVLLEILVPSAYVSLFDPAKYLSSTREWIGDQKASRAAEAGLYTGAFRGGGSTFALADHRVGGPFLEPLSLGYFAFLMSTYYAGLHRGSLAFKFMAITICIVLALASDTRIATGLIVLSSVFLIMRLRLPVLLLWLTFPVVLIAFYLVYLGHFSFMYGDTLGRLSITFDALGQVDLGQILVGQVPLGRVGDSGILYMLRSVGLLGMPIAVWFYSGAFTYRRGSNVAFFVMMTVYLTITLMFGGASLSIKTASLLGFLVGLAAVSAKKAELREPVEAPA